MTRMVNMIILLMLVVTLCSCATHQTGLGEGPAQTLLAAYRGPLNSLSGVRGAQCPMAPSCSEYMHQAIAKHGAVKGWLMGTERLMRCGHEDLRHVKIVRVNGSTKIYDPLEYNDFWWAKASLSQPAISPSK